MFTSQDAQHQDDEVIEQGTISPEHLEYAEASIRELGKHLCELEREEEVS